MRKVVVSLACLFLLFTSPALAGGGGRGGGICPGFAEGSTVSLLDSCFKGTAHFAPADASVTVRNDGAIPHDYTAVDGSFATGLLQGGESTEVEGLDPGIYRVYCTLHGTPTGEGMAGVLVVGDSTPGAAAAVAGGVGPAAGANQQGWGPVTVGTATGLALAALAVATLSLRRTRQDMEPDVLT